jgi:cyclophilin family peptidyl-prolyl cis-trans isomerase
MKSLLFPLALAGLMAAASSAQTPAVSAAPALSPGEIVAAAPHGDWVAISPADLVVMDLAADAKGRARRVAIQLIPAPFSQGWVGNIRKLVAARWYDGISVNRVQDNYVVQWGDADGEDPKKAKVLPGGLGLMPESAYTNHNRTIPIRIVVDKPQADPYSSGTSFWNGWPSGSDDTEVWPVHCYGMVGVGRGMSPDTGSGAELYTVIGHAPRHLDRNIALVGRVIEGIEHLSSLPRGTGVLGFYENAEERVPILSVRMGNEVAGLPAFQYLSTESGSFATYADARANRRDPFFIRPAGGADICNIPVPVRRAPAGKNP